MRERIQIAMENAASEDDFLEALEDEGVKARYGTSKRYGEYIAYELVDVPPHMEGAGRKYKARSYTLGDAYGVEALREKLREKANELLRMVEQHGNAAESKSDLPDFSQDELNTEAAALLPANGITEMTHTPTIKPMDVQTLRNTVDSVIRGLRDIRTETPAPAQPVNTATAPPTATEGTDSAPVPKRPTQGATAPQTGTLSGMAKLEMILKEADDKEAQRQLKNQQDDMDWLPYR